MKSIVTSVAVADYCQGMERNEYIVNRKYQRSDQVWPVAARSFFIETILLDFPTPKMWLYQRLIISTKTTVKEIVDGQQRSKALLDFYQGKLRLSQTNLDDRFAGRKFEELEDEDQAVFLHYGLNFDMFMNATDEEVRAVFRRMNTFTFPLNAEETRHARYQGAFKWFIHRVSEDYSNLFLRAGVFSEKQLTRMADAKLLTEICRAFDFGITTTNAVQLDRMYKDNDTKFSEETEYESWIRQGLDTILHNESLWETGLMKPYNFYSLCLAYIQAFGLYGIVSEPHDPLIGTFQPDDPNYNLSQLASAMNVEEGDPLYRDLDPGIKSFLAATKDRTNVAQQRVRRFESFLSALGAIQP